MSRSRDNYPWPQALKHGTQICYCLACKQRKPGHRDYKRDRLAKKIVRRDVALMLATYEPMSDPGHPDYNACLCGECACETARSA